MNEADRRRLSAFHEAAHAVVFHLFELPVDLIVLAQYGAGVCVHEENQPSSRGLVLGCLAGNAADRRMLEGRPDDLRARESGWEKDLQDADDILKSLGNTETLHDAQRESDELVQAHWSVICALAERLIAQSEYHFRDAAEWPHESYGDSKIEGQVVREIIELHMG